MLDRIKIRRKLEKSLTGLLFLIEEMEITFRVQYDSSFGDQLDGNVSLLRLVDEIVEDLNDVMIEILGLCDVELKR